MKRKGEKIFITGGLGFIGSNLARLFVESSDQVFVYDSLRYYISPFKMHHFNSYLMERNRKLRRKAKLIEGDIRNADMLRKTITEINPERIIHLAALPLDEVADRFPEEAIDVNVLGTVNVLRVMDGISKIKKFVYISSSMVYGDFLYTPCDEEHPTNPIGIYGGTKLSAEVMTRAYCHKLRVPFCIIRPSTVYGPTECNQRVTQLFIERAIAGLPLVLYDGGETELDFTYVEDAAMGIYLATKNDKVGNQIFNITRGEGRSLKELVEILRKYFPNIKTTIRRRFSQARKPKRGALDISKAKSLLGYQPKYSLESGIAKYISFLKKGGYC